MSILAKINNAMLSIGSKLNLCKKKMNYALNTEIDTGNKWIDGSPIYVKVLTTTVKKAGTAFEYTDYATPGISRIVDYSSYVDIGSQLWKNYNNGATYWQTVILWSNENIKLGLKGNYSGVAGKTVYFFVYYTKSTS